MKDEVEVDLGTTSEGYKVDSTSVKILNLGDGLSKATKVDPVLVHAGEVVYFAVKAKKIKDNYVFDFDDDDNVKGVVLEQVFSASSATFVDEDVVIGAITRMNTKISNAEALKKAGQGSMLKTCTVCGWTEGQDPIECEGTPFHTFPDTYNGQ